LDEAHRARDRPLVLTSDPITDARSRHGQADQRADAYAGPVLTGLAHAAVCVPDVDEATRWYSATLGLRVLSPPYRMEGGAIDHDMGELVPSPVVVKAAIVGFGSDDHVLELVEYPSAPVAPPGSERPTVTRVGITHVGMLCDDIAATRSELESRGVEFLTSGIADVAGLRTTWCCDPWGTVIILLEKGAATRPYWGQYQP
jgi:catechol 2,3-dioxygenase-like lactoylglutathione lyase family enzyme